MTVTLYTTHLVRHFPLSGPPAIACAWMFCRCRVEDLNIMAADDGGHVAHTAVAVFYVVSIEQLVVLVVVWEMLNHKIQEVLGNVCCHVWLNGGLNHITLRLRFLHIVLVTTIF